jgi:hypothetical protein
VIKTYDICSTRIVYGLYDNAAIITSPNYPRYTMVPDDCVVKIIAPSDKIIRIWAAVDMKYSDYNDQ